MTGLFEIYWNTIGGPVSRFKGLLVDWFPFSVTELLLWTGIISSVLLIVKLIGKPQNAYTALGAIRMKIHSFHPILYMSFGPILLFLLAAGQGALPWSPMPTFLRQQLHQHWKVPSLDESAYEGFHDNFQKKIASEFNWNEYQNFNEKTVLEKCNSSLNAIMSELNLTKGRELKRIKKMRGLSRLFGLSYGGPAYHDPLTGEAAMVNYEDLPTPQYWRYQAVCHETVHAKGFSREIDTEILTALALLKSENYGMQISGYLMFLKKSGKSYSLPDELIQERKNTLDARKKVRASQPFVRFLTRINKALGIQNSPGKYGSRKKDEEWNPEHAFFTTVVYLAEHLNLELSANGQEE